MGRRAAVRTRVNVRLPRVPMALPLLLGASVACGSPPADQPEPLEGTDLVSGSSFVRYGLLVIPAGGGVAEFRSIANPSAVRWTGRMELGSVTAAHSLGSSAVLRDGSELRLYSTSPTETATPLPDAPPEARWIPSAAGGALVAGDRILALTASTAVEITASGEVRWAAPAGDHVVGLVEAAGGPELVVWEPGEDTPVGARAVGTRGPAVVTGWGRQVVTPSADGRGLTAWSIPDLDPGETLQTNGPPTVLATSPSQHRVFAAAGDRARFVSVDRYEWREVGSSRVDAPLTALRPGITGGRLVAFDGSRTWSVGIGETELEPLPGEWRPDLPLALPGGGVLVSTGDGPHLLASGVGDSEPVDGPADAWWLPFRWGPRLPVTSVAVGEDETMRDENDAMEATADTVAPAPGRVGLLTMGTPPGRPRVPEARAGVPRSVADEPGTPAADESLEPPAGFYAVVASAREPVRLGGMRRRLEGSGYATHVLRQPDAANNTWHRLLVGPYTSRPDAEAVARELRREQGIDAWVHEESDGESERRRS